jgi:hypothetical protein
MDINILRDKWQEFLSASISAKYGNSEKDTKEMINKLEEFDKFWEDFKNEQSRNREGSTGEVDESRV